ncbi:MAG: P-II family nitrogen regulator [Gammaproteobacteria bacterium]
MNNSNITYLTDVALITCVVKIGLSDVILKAARDVGVITGAISYHARGYGARERLGLLGIAVEAEKEVVSILVSSEQQDTVVNSICRAGKLDAPGMGYLYITPLEKVATYIPQDVINKLEEGS